MAKPIHIVVVDDNQDIRTVLKEGLEEAGYCVSLAEGGQALIALLGAELVDLAVLDATLPCEHGVSLARYLKRLGIPVVMMSGSIEIVENAEVNETRFLSKPFHMAELLEAIEKSLNAPP